MKLKVTFPGNKKVNAEINGHTIKTDQGKMSGGDGTAPDPFSLFLSSLATCAGIFVKSFCDQRDINTENFYLTQEASFNPVKRMIDKFLIEIHVDDNLPKKYEKAVINSASMCAVKKHLSSDIETIIKVVR